MSGLSRRLGNLRTCESSDLLSLCEAAELDPRIHLTGCTFSDSDMKSTTLRDADLRSCDFSGANLRESDFAYSDFRDCDFTNCDLSYSNFEYCDFTGSRFENSNLYGILDEGAIGLPGASPPHQHLSDSFWTKGRDDYGYWLEGNVAGVRLRCRWIPKRTRTVDGAGNLQIENGFWMFETPVTQELWTAVMSNNPSRFGGARVPVQRISWVECQDFMEMVNSMLPDLVLSLPTAEEWEFACVSKVGGVEFNPRSTEIRHGMQNPAKVAMHRPNAFGLFDMLGNVSEWCSDLSQNDRRMRIIKGGSFLHDLSRANAKYVNSVHEMEGNITLGFRCICKDSKEE